MWKCMVRRPVALIKIMLFGIITVNSARLWKTDTTDASVGRIQKETKMKGPRRLSCKNAAEASVYPTPAGVEWWTLRRV